MSVVHLIHRAGQLADEVFSKTIPDVTARQGVVLAVMGGDPNGYSQTQLVDLTGIDRSTMADLMRRLERKGMIVRKRSRADARRMVCKLTPDGQKVARAICKMQGQTDDELLANVPARFRVAFKIGLEHLAKAWPQAEPA